MKTSQMRFCAISTHSPQIIYSIMSFFANTKLNMKDYEIFTRIKNQKDWNVIKTKNHELNYFIFLDKNYLGEDTVYLLFQESNGKKDWKDNLNFLPIYTKVYKNQETEIKAHRGFVYEYKSGNDEIMQDLYEFCKLNNVYNVIISGWSNGGAMAILAAEDFFYRYKIKPTLITFGSPKVCANKKTAKQILDCCKLVKEWANRSDIVTKLPLFGEHVNKLDLGKWSLKGLFNPWTNHTQYDIEIKKIMGE